MKLAVAAILIVATFNCIAAEPKNAPLRASRLVYPVKMQLDNSDWTILEPIRLRLTFHGDKGMLDGLMVRVFRGSVSFLSGENQPTICNMFRSIVFRPRISDVQNKGDGFSTVLNLGIAPSKEWLDLQEGFGSARTDYVIVFEQSRAAVSRFGDTHWVLEDMLLNKHDTKVYFSKYGIPVTVSASVASSAGGSVIASLVGPYRERHPVEPLRDQECRAITEVGAELTIMTAEACAPPKSESVATLKVPTAAASLSKVESPL